MRRITLLSLVVVLMAGLLLVGCSGEEAEPTAPSPTQTDTTPATTTPTQPAMETVKWKYADFAPPDDVAQVAGKWFFDELASRSEGRFECEYFFSGSLVEGAEILNGIKAGVCEAGGLGSFYSTHLPLWSMEMLPSLFQFLDNTRESQMTFQAVMAEWADTPLIKDELSQWNAMYLGEQVPLQFTFFAPYPITSLADIQGKRLRCVGLAQKLIEDLGAVPVMIIPPEIYDAVSKGTIDGIVQSWPLYQSFGWYEKAPYITEGAAIGAGPSTKVVNIEAYEALPDDLKAIFNELMAEYPTKVADAFGSGFEEAVKEFEESGVEFVEFSAEDKAIMIESSQKIHVEHVADLEKDGIPAKEAYNSLQTIMQKHVQDYEPFVMD